MVDLSASQESTASNDLEAQKEEEEQNKIIAKQALDTYVNRQRKEIDALNRKVARTSKERDAYVREIEESSLQVYEQAIKDAEAYFAETTESAADVCKQVLMHLDKTCHGLLEGLNRESEAIDPKDAEQVAENLATNFDNNIQERSRWRRRVVKDNYNELKEQLIAAQNAIKADEVAKATIVIMQANL